MRSKFTFIVLLNYPAACSILMQNGVLLCNWLIVCFFYMIIVWSSFVIMPFLPTESEAHSSMEPVLSCKFRSNSRAHISFDSLAPSNAHWKIGKYENKYEWLWLWSVHKFGGLHWLVRSLDWQKARLNHQIHVCRWKRNSTTKNKSKAD